MPVAVPPMPHLPPPSAATAAAYPMPKPRAPQRSLQQREDEIALVEREWPTKEGVTIIKKWTSLDARGGVAYVRDHKVVPRIVAKVGLTQVPTAIVTSEPGHVLGLPSDTHPTEKLGITLRFKEYNEGQVVYKEDKKTYWLTQLGRGEALSMRGNAEGVGLFHLPVAKYKVVVVFPLTTIGLLSNAYVVDTLKAVMATHEKRTVEEIEVALKLFEVQARADNTAYVTCTPPIAKRILAASGCRDITFSCEGIEMHVLQVPVQADHKIDTIVQIAKPDYGYAYKRKEEVVLKLRYSTDAKRQAAHQELTDRHYIVPLPLPLFAVEGLSDATTEDDVRMLCS